MNRSFWRGKRVLVTGHTGFKGSWLCTWLQSLGADVTGYALRPATQPNLFDVAQVGNEMKSVIGDIRDADALQAAVRDAAPEIVIHMAAQPLVRYSYANPAETYGTNVMGLVNLLEAVRATPSIRAVVNVTSDKCYENREWVWGYRECDPMGGHDPYSSSKGCAELVTSAYRSSYFSSERYQDHGVALASARAGNVIGGGDWAQDRLIPDIIRSIQRGEPVRIRNPKAIRPWQHVLEPLSGYLELAERLFTVGPDFAEGWNFGPNESDVKTVEWIVDRFTSLWGDGASWQFDEAPHPHEATYLKLDCSKAAARLGWHPRWNLETSLHRIATWHKNHAAAQDMHAVVLSQITEFENCYVG
ncbi:CDP-glucose 4,6-dehydratase [Trinickia fusca]|nr:CDP-glucose 4,6-dehydratase [Trinickia fusca]